MTYVCGGCGRTHSKSGKPFTQHTLRQHVQDAHPKADRHLDVLDDTGLEMTRLIADDEPDGVFWALANEFDE